MIDRIKRVPLRKVWKHEAHDFTVWLEENIDVLTEVVGFQLSNPEREQSTGNFNVDIKADDESGDVVVIENQLEKSDHDHLGKIITYLSAFDAKKAIWIVKEPRPEHVKAISNLNESFSGCDFWLLKIEAIQIGDSNPAPLITKIVGPSEEARSVGKIKKEDSERHRLRLAFWTKFLEQAKGTLPLFNTISPTKDVWIGKFVNKGFCYSFWITKDGIRSELRIDFGKEQEEYNLSVFNDLYVHHQEIESAYGKELEWNDADGYRVCIVRDVFKNGGYRNPEGEWSKIAGEAIDAMVRLEKATKPYISKIK
jgi:hypothetical protein